MNPIQLGMVGLGTVGSGVVTVLLRNQTEITRRAGRAIRIKKVAVRDIKKERACDTHSFELVTDVHSVITDPDITIIVELAGGEEEALEIVLQAILAGKHVITGNKALIAKHGNQIFKAASEAGVMVLFEAAVGGGIPIIKAMREGLAANCIQSVAGIINGTCNYILSSMHSSGLDFEDCLSGAQSAGYAESDPSFDIDGIDAAHKLTILASLAFGIPLQFSKVYVEGIRDIELSDIRYAQQLGYTIKHLAITRHSPRGVECRVHPTLIPSFETLAHVNGAMNAVYVVGDAVGPTLYYGKGAGAFSTASAVIADLIEVVRTMTSDPHHRVPHLAFQPESIEDIPILPISDIYTRYYLRILALDKPGVLADITRILAHSEISIESILQKEKEQHNGVIPIVIMTHLVKESMMNGALAEIQSLSDVKEPIVRMRIEMLNNIEG